MEKEDLKNIIKYRCYSINLHSVEGEIYLTADLNLEDNIIEYTVIEGDHFTIFNDFNDAFEYYSQFC